MMKKITKNSSQRYLAFAMATVTAVSSLAFLGLGQASAVPFTQTFVRLDRDKAVTTTSGRVCIKPSTANAGATISQVKVTFPTTTATDYVVSTTVANWATTTTGLDTGQTALPITNASITVSGKAVTFPLTTPAVLSTSNLYCFNFGTGATPGLTTSSAGASETTQGKVESYSSGPTLQDQTTISFSIISNDQVTISNATVPPSFQFTLSGGGTDSFTANLIPGNVVQTTGITATVTTNAATGYIVWAQDLNSKAGNGALYSTVANYKIGGSTAPGAASHTFTGEDYGLAVVVTGTGTADAAYDGSGSKAGTLSPNAGASNTYTFFPIASATAPANGDSISLKLQARSSATTPAASDYSDTISYVGAGKF